MPEKVSGEDFWARYRFRVGELTAEEARRQQVLAQNAGLKAEVAIPDLDLTWGDDDDDDDDESAPTRHADSDAGRGEVGTADDGEHKVGRLGPGSHRRSRPPRCDQCYRRHPRRTALAAPNRRLLRRRRQRQPRHTTTTMTGRTGRSLRRSTMS